MSETLKQLGADRADGSAGSTGPERLQEPHLSYYLAVRAQYHAAQLQATALAQALQAITQVAGRFYDTGPEDGIDAEGFLHRVPRPEPERELP